MQFPDSVTIVEVGPRDGLQEQKTFVPTAVKLEFLRILADAGFPRIEATSFMNPKWIPALADADDVARQLKDIPASASSFLWSALIPNQKGYERARDAGLPEVALVISASDSHNKANLNRTTRESIAGFQEMASHAKQDGIRIRGAVATAFGCPFEGEVRVERVLDVATAYAEMGAAEICLADTIGSGHPRQVNELFNTVARALPGVPLSAHFHDRRGFGLANVLAALDAGVRIFDSSVGGLGGCPYAPGAPGNISTRSLVYFFEEMGVRTGIRMDRLEEAETLILGAL